MVRIREWGHVLIPGELHDLKGKFIKTSRVTPRETSALFATLRAVLADAEAWRRVRAVINSEGTGRWFGTDKAKGVRTSADELACHCFFEQAQVLYAIADILAEEQMVRLREGLVKAWDGNGNEFNLVCGHPRSTIVSSGEGTNYCGECEKAKMKRGEHA